MINLRIERETECYVHFVAFVNKGTPRLTRLTCVTYGFGDISIYIEKNFLTSWNRGTLLVGMDYSSVKVARHTFTRIVSAIMDYNRIEGYLWVNEGTYL